MSLYLLWDHTEELIGKAIQRVSIFRSDGANRGVEVTDDACWGFHEDTENESLKSLYTVTYYDGFGGEIFSVTNDRIRKIVSTPQHCVVSICLRDGMGAPDAGRLVELTLPGRTSNRRFFYTNQMGRVRLPLLHGTRVLLNISGRYEALDVVVPSKHEASWEDLVQNGTRIEADQRGLI